MTWIKLGNPRPRLAALPYRSMTWQDGERTQLTPGSSLADVNLSDLLNSRRTGRTFARVRMEDLSTLLWLTCRIQRTLPSTSGFPLSLCPAPSSGAIHPINVLVQGHASEAWQRYDPLEHSLVTVLDSEGLAVTTHKEACEVLEVQQGLLIGLAAEPGKTVAKYQEASSLVWRDAGVLLGYLSIVAEALGLNFCPLGITGDPSIGNLDKEGRLFGVGLAILGSR